MGSARPPFRRIPDDAPPLGPPGGSRRLPARPSRHARGRRPARPGRPRRRSRRRRSRRNLRRVRPGASGGDGAEFRRRDPSPGVPVWPECRPPGVGRGSGLRIPRQRRLRQWRLMRAAEVVADPLHSQTVTSEAALGPPGGRPRADTASPARRLSARKSPDPLCGENRERQHPPPKGSAVMDERQVTSQQPRGRPGVADRPG